jgi:hypothetical protein
MAPIADEAEALDVIGPLCASLRFDCVRAAHQFAHSREWDSALRSPRPEPRLFAEPICPDDPEAPRMDADELMRAEVDAARSRATVAHGGSSNGAASASALQMEAPPPECWHADWKWLQMASDFLRAYEVGAANALA